MITFDAAKLKHPNTGLYHFTLQLARALKTAGVETDFFTTHPALLANIGIPDARKVGALDKLCRRNPRGSKVWHTPYQFSSYPPPRGVRQVLTVHDLNFLYEKSEPKQAGYIRKLQREIDRVDYIVAISQFSVDELERFVDLHGKPRKVVYNGCNIPDSPAAEPGYQPSRRFFYGVGAMLPKKNWHVLPELLVDAEDRELVISGTGSPAYARELLVRAATLGVADRATLTGGVSEGENGGAWNAVMPLSFRWWRRD